MSETNSWLTTGINPYKPRVELNHRHGTNNGQAKMDPDKVRELKHLRGEGWTMQALAQRYGINRSQVMRILRGNYWSHVE